MQNFRLISSLVSEIDAFKETYRGAILCIFLQANDFPQILNGCRIRILKDRNLKFSGNTQQLVRCSAYSKEHLTVHWLVWECHENIKNLFVSLQTPDFGILFCPFGFNLELWLSTNNKPCTNTPYKYRKMFDITSSAIYLLASRITKKCETQETRYNISSFRLPDSNKTVLTVRVCHCTTASIH